MEDPKSPGTPIKLERWFPFSLISAILSPVSSKLHPVSAASLNSRYMSADYVGPLFPVRDPPEDAESSVVRAMVNLLLCEYHPPVVFHYLASLRRGTNSCQLKLHVFRLLCYSVSDILSGVLFIGSPALSVTILYRSILLWYRSGNLPP